MEGKQQYRVFKFPDCEKYGVSDDFAEYTVVFCDTKFHADLICDELNKKNQEIRELKEELEKYKGKVGG